jgi:4-hydroxy-tetrahydrodipicolinate reductase
MLRLAISGASGRMGGEIIKIIAASPDRFNLEAKASRSEGSVKDWDASNIDAVVDFSLPESFDEVFNWCATHNKPLVSGTTGFDVDEYKKKASDFPFLHSGNFSMGIAALIESLKNFKKMDSELKIWIEDIHHIHKLDAPSGTAVKIEDEIKKSLKASGAKIESIREGEVFGVHKVHIESANEHITLEHEALNRGVFAVGAMNALEWLAGQKPGVYKFEDYLSF